MKLAPRPLRVELLEDRSLPAIFGVPWPNAGDVTISFVPDGAPLAGGSASNLFAVLDAAMPRDVWQGEIVRAFQTWAAQANVNVRVVPDSGDPLGTPGAVQGDARFGDVRVAAAALSPDAVGSGAPFSWTGTTLAGDLLLNNAMSFNVGGGAGKYDLYTIALQESGHILGLDNSPDESSVMFTKYLGPRAGLSAADIADVQELYDARSAGFDKLSGTGTVTAINPVSDGGSNETRATATFLKSKDQADARFDAVYNGKIESSGDVDYYKIQVPKAVGNKDINLVVMIWGLKRGELNPGVHLYEQDGTPVPYRVLSNDDGLVAVQAAKLLAGKHVFVQVVPRDKADAARNVGGYQLLVDFGDKPVVLFNDLATAKLSDTKASDEASLTINRGALMAFSLAARTEDGQYAEMTMTIVDADGNVVTTLTAKAGRAAVTRTLYLAAGTYSVKYSASGAGLASGLTYNLMGHTLSDNVGPYSTTDSGSNGGYTYTGEKSSSWSNQYWF